jgi:hypothetical protein
MHGDGMGKCGSVQRGGCCNTSQNVHCSQHQCYFTTTAIGCTTAAHCSYKRERARCRQQHLSSRRVHERVGVCVCVCVCVCVWVGEGSG